VPVRFRLRTRGTSTGEGATLWVNASTGSDSNTIAQVRAGAGSVQWATIYRAARGVAPGGGADVSAQAAVAGDIVSIAAGTYSGVGTGDGADVYCNPVNSGTAGNPITFRAVGTVTLIYSSSDGPYIGAVSRDYITWAGEFWIDEADCPSATSGGAFVIRLLDATNIIFDGLRIIADPTVLPADNHVGIFMSTSEAVEIRNCTISGFSNDEANNVENASGIEIYTTGNIIIEHNTFFGNGSAIHEKAPHDGATNNTGPVWIRYNLCYDNSTGIVIHRAPHTSGDPCLIYQNIVRDGVIHYVGETTTAFAMRLFSDATSPMHVKIFNNTVDGCDAALLIRTANTFQANAGHLWWNNIVRDIATHVLWNIDGGASNFTDKARFDAEHNVYYETPTDFANTAGTDISFASWQGATYDQDDDDGGSDDSIIGSDPLFVNYASDDFHLQGGSPALTIGRAIYSIGGSDDTVIPAGCYITGSEVIGPE